MATKILLLTGVVTSVIGGVVHVGSHAYVRTEEKIKEAFVQTREGFIADIARKAGYEKPSPTPTIEEAKTFEEMATREAKKAGVNPDLVLALMHHESGKNPNAKSSVGAIGLMQVMPFNAKRCHLELYELWDPAKNIKCGIRILKEDLIDAKWNPVEALQRYNGGAKCVGKCAESINHSRSVMAAWAKDKIGFEP